MLVLAFMDQNIYHNWEREREREREREELLGRGGEHIREKRKWEKVLGKLKMGRAFATTN